MRLYAFVCLSAFVYICGVCVLWACGYAFAGVWACVYVCVYMCVCMCVCVCIGVHVCEYHRTDTDDNSH